jgi:hypothetical protein
MFDCADLRFNKIHHKAAYAESDELVERWLKSHPEVKRHIFARFAGVSFANLDGSSRQNALAECQPLDPLVLKWESNNPVSNTAISVSRENGHQLGYLESQLGKDIFKHLQKGEHWSGFIVHVGRPAEYLGAIIVLVKTPILALPSAH